MPTRPLLAPALAAAALALSALAAACGPMPTLADEGPVRPTSLRFTLEPENSFSGQPISPAVAVTVFESTGDTAFDAAASIRVSIAFGTGAPAARLHGDTVLAAVNGTAVFTNVSIDSAGTGYRLLATSDGLGSALSDTFNVAHP
ncbi:MAG: hypothetical protein ABR998_14040 [Gemmatimonadales bacterium]|jgi:hypothetical protein